MSTNPATHAFVGVCPKCGLLNYLAVDLPIDDPDGEEYAARSGAEIMEILRDGGRVEYVTIPESRARAFCSCDGTLGSLKEAE